MKTLLFSDSEIWEIFKLLAAILHLGNLKYKEVISNNMDGTEINDMENLDRVAKFLAVDSNSLLESLTRKTISAYGEKVILNISRQQAIDARDAFVKAIYGKIFIKVVDKINDAIYKTAPSQVSIGVLDIFGFENFDFNSFEQLCINYANENLQQFFVQHIFKVNWKYFW